MADALTLHLPDRAAMAAFAQRVGRVVRAGDVLVLTGNLGAGKTTFTQFLARSLDVRGRVSSPTFVIAREHPPRGAGPALVHVDAYRLGGADEFDDLGLDASLDESATVVEWGRGMADSLGDHLDVEILRGEMGGSDWAGGFDEADGADEDDEPDDDLGESRTVVLTAHGEQWAGRLAELDPRPSPEEAP